MNRPASVLVVLLAALIVLWGDTVLTAWVKAGDPDEDQYPYPRYLPAILRQWHPNAPPKIMPPIPDFGTAIGTAIRIMLDRYATDPDDPLESLGWYVMDVAPPQHYTVTGEGTHDLLFEPEEDFAGSEAIILILRDPHGASDQQQITLSWY